METNTMVGGVVLLYPLPFNQKLPENDWDGLDLARRLDLANIGFKEVNGPLVNGLYAITCTWNGSEYQLDMKKVKIDAVLEEYLKGGE